MKTLLKSYVIMNRNRICMAIALFIAALGTVTIMRNREMVVEAKMQEAQQSIAKEVLRFHVLANSDSEDDQALKMKVKEAVINYMAESLPHAESLEQTRTWVDNNQAGILEIARETIAREGYEYEAAVSLESCYFPDKTYGDVMFPAGQYEALRIEIGQAKGHNWWCVLYPNLCFVDATHAVVPEEGKEELENVLTEEEYEMVTSTTSFEVKWFFLPEE